MDSFFGFIGGVIKIILAGFICLCVIGWLIGGDGEEETSNVKTATPLVSFTTKELNTLYSNNPVAADTKYEGEVVSVVGRIVGITQTKFGNDPVLILEHSIQCNFDDSQATAFSMVSTGDTVRVKGHAEGILNGNVLIDNCVIY